jgi:2'-hydroxyisoflavone reductase
MASSRREFLQKSALAGGAVHLGALDRLFAAREGIEQASRSLRILILGGTSLIGPQQVRYALERGHTVTLFNRGRTNPHLFPEVEKLRGDRDNDIEALKGRDWDVVIDNHPSIPRWVRTTAQLLEDHAEQYVFVSSISAYADNSVIGQDETGQTAELEDPTVEEVTGATYGGLKVLCEREAQKAFPETALIVRPGLIVGPGDNSDRFTYWPVRIDRGGEVMGPGDGSDPTQIIDVRDLGEWMIHMVEQRHAGVYNATGPYRPLQMDEMLYGIKAVTSREVSFTWVEADFLREQGVRAWSHMPTWVPPTDGMEGFSRYSIARAVEKGLTFRPLADTATATLEWHYARPEERQQNLRAGIAPDREKEVLEAWHARNGF